MSANDKRIITMIKVLINNIEGYTDSYIITDEDTIMLETHSLMKSNEPKVFWNGEEIGILDAIERIVSK